MRRPISISLLFLACVAGPAAAQERPRMLVPDAFEIVELADGVHAVLRRDPPDDAANSNVLVIVNERDVVVVDGTLTPASAEATIAAIRTLTPNPVRYVINTHWHDDHVLGNSAYADAFPGVEFIGHPFTRRMIGETVAPSLETNKTAYARELEGIEKRLAAGVRRDGAPLTSEERARVERTAELYRAVLVQMPRIRITAPSLLVDESMTIWRGEREIRVLFLGRGNTAGDLVVHLPKEGIVATGDLLVHPLPYAFGSFLGDWSATLGRVEALKAHVMMPGHGELLRDMTYLTLVRELVTAMSTQMKDAVAKGLTLDQARAALKLDALRARFTGNAPGKNASFLALFVMPASERAYQEAKGEIK